MAHNFRVIESSSEFGRRGEPRFFAVCLEVNHEKRMACFVSRLQNNPRMAFVMGHVHQESARGIPNRLANSPKYRGIGQ